MQENEFYVYVLRSEKDNKLYVGYTSDLELRFKQHNSGLVDSTKFRRPFKLVHFEKHENKNVSQSRERFFKSGKGREFLNRLITKKSG
ncbi:MAG: GIY-YIG nuclease family protein [Elusimicrobia bacterium]|nr:GIY-YIG nuclease family protein [Elusimicrobiota bacterium]